MIDHKKCQTVSTTERKRRVTKKCMKTAYYVAKKIQAVHKNFPQTIDFLQQLPEDIEKHFQEASSEATYTSKNLQMNS